MRRVRLGFGSCFVAIGLAQAAPIINGGGIVNAASYAHPELPNGSIAQGSIFAIIGSGLGPASPVKASYFPLPAAQGLAGTFVKVSASGQSIDCILLSTSSTLITAILPSGTPLGNHTLTVSYQDEASSSETFHVVRNSFGIFAPNQAGSGPALVHNVAGPTELTVNTVYAPARPDQKIVIHGTGLGPVAGDEAAAPLPGDQSDLDVEVFIGGRPAVVESRGRSTCCAGQDEITAIVPQGVVGCYVPVAVKIGDTVSNYVSIAVSDDGQVCKGQGAGELTSEELLKMQQTGQLQTGILFLDRLSLLSAAGMGGAIEMASAAFSTSAPSLTNRSIGLLGLAPAIGTCTVQSGPVAFGSVTSPGLSAGVLLLANSRYTVAVNASTPGYYTANLYSLFPYSGSFGFPLLAAGNMRLSNGSGGNSVGPFLADFTFPNDPSWPLRNLTVVVPRRQGLDISWANREPDSEVFIYGSSNTRDASTAFVCREQAAAGHLRIPAEVLLAMPATDSWGNGLIAIATRQTQRFNAPGLDVGLIEGVHISAKTVTYQ